jgi:hypothetical protein
MTNFERALGRRQLCHATSFAAAHAYGDAILVRHRARNR